MQCVCSIVYSERPPSSEITHKKEEKQSDYNIVSKFQKWMLVVLVLVFFNFIERAILVVACVWLEL